MTDVLTSEQRHKCMSHIRGKNTKPELLVRKYLYAHGFRYRLYRNDLPGKPDIVLTKYKTVIFINGCFWHAHPGCKYATTPKTNTEFWTAKIENNCERDKQNHRMLQDMGWKVIVIWECQLKPAVIENTLTDLINNLNSIVPQHKHIIPYSIPEEEISIAAEPAIDYNKTK